jgi:hypothetical protein
MTAMDLARWAADAFAGYDVAATHRIVTAATGPGPLPDHVSARVDAFTGTVGLPRPVGVVLARVSPDALGSTAPVDAVVRRVLLTRNALLVEAVPPGSTAADGDLDAWHAAVAIRVRHLASLAEGAGAPAGVLQMLDEPGTVDLVLDPVAGAPVVVIVDEGAHATPAAEPFRRSRALPLASAAEPFSRRRALPRAEGPWERGFSPWERGFGGEPDAIVLTVGAGGCTDLGHAVRTARGVLRETGGDRVRVYTGDPDVPLRIAAALPVTRVAVGDLEMPPPPPDGLLTWTRISVDRPAGRQPWVSPGAPVPVYPRASNESP